MLVTLNGNTEKILAYVRNSGLSEEKYLALIPEMKLYRQLFQLKYKEDETNPVFLRKKLGLSSDMELAKRLEVLDAWITSQKALNLELICPECLLCAVYDDSERGDRVCILCGVVANASYDEGVSFDDSIDRDSTFQPSSKLSFSDGLGNTLKSQEIHRLLNNSDVELSEFKKTNPQEASDLLLFGLTVKDGFAYRLSQGYVRRLPLADVDNLFNQKDMPLRKYKVGLIVDSYTQDNKGVLVYAELLCDKYGISNPIFKNSLGIKVRKARAALKQNGNARPRIHPLVESMFYLCLLDFKKKTEAQKAKTHLQHIDLSVINLFVEYEIFKLQHSKPNLDPSILNAYEKRC